MKHHEHGYKWLPVERVVELLTQLPSGTKVVPNNVNNLQLLDAEDNYIGYVEFTSRGELEWLMKE